MLDAYVIEEIKRRDRGQALDDRPVVELPMPSPPAPGPRDHGDDSGEERDRGVVIIDYSA